MPITFSEKDFESPVFTEADFATPNIIDVRGIKPVRRISSPLENDTTPFYEPPTSFWNPMPVQLVRHPETALEGAYNTTVKGLRSFLTPVGVGAAALLPIKPLQPLVVGALAGLGAKQVGEGLGQQFAGEHWYSPTPGLTPGQRVEGFGDVGQGALMSAFAPLLGYKGAVEGRPAPYLPFEYMPPRPEPQGPSVSVSPPLIDVSTVPPERPQYRIAYPGQRLLTERTGTEPPAPDPNWQVTVQSPTGPVPGYVQIDDVAGGMNRWSAGPVTLRNQGYDIPDFSNLPQGKYTYQQAVNLLEQQKGTAYDTQSQGGIQSGLPPNRPELRNLPQQETSTATTAADKEVPVRTLMDPEAAVLRHEFLPWVEDLNRRREIVDYYNRTGDAAGAEAMAKPFRYAGLRSRLEDAVSGLPEREQEASFQKFDKAWEQKFGPVPEKGTTGKGTIVYKDSTTHQKITDPESGGVIEYYRQEGRNAIYLDHIEVPPSSQNKGVASRLLKPLLELADKKGLLIEGVNYPGSPGRAVQLFRFLNKHDFSWDEKGLTEEKVREDAKLDEWHTFERKPRDIKQGTGGEEPLSGRLYGGLFFLDPDFWRSQIGVAKNIAMDAQQLYNRMRNRLGEGSATWREVDTPEFRAFMATGKRTPEEVQSFVEEHGPRVEVRKFGVGTMTAQETRKAELQHELDTKYPGWFNMSRNDLKERDPSGKALGLSDEWNKLGTEIANADKSHWQSIAPKPEKDMPGYVEIAVVKPRKAISFEEYQRQFGSGKLAEDQADYQDYVKRGNANVHEVTQFPSTHSFPPNTLGWARGYMETLPNGKKVFHIIEVQSDWAQRYRENKATYDTEERAMIDRGEARAQYKDIEDPLLAHYERLALKAAIEHAREQGATKVAISDAETAMMTEGHDAMENAYVAPPDDWKGTAEHWIATQKPEIPQEPGMRLHYDTILPRIMEELTGQKGEKVSFGEHKMAFEEQTRGVDEEGNRTGGFRQQRPDLIFRNEAGQPKTDVSARAYDIGKAKENFTLMGKDKPPTINEIGGAVKAGTKLYSGLPFMDPDFWRQAKELLDYARAPKTRVSFAQSAKDALPDFMPRDDANRLAAEKFGMERIPSFNVSLFGKQFEINPWGGKGRVANDQDAAVAAWFAERHGVGPAIASAVGEQIRGWVNRAFKADKEGNLDVQLNDPKASRKISDVFEGLKAGNGKYALSPEQTRTWLNIVKPLLDRMTELTKQYDLVTTLPEYFPRIVMKLPREQQPGMGGRRVGSKQFFQHERAFSTEQEGWQKGVQYSTDVEARLLRGIERLYRAIADERLANDPALGARTRGQLISDLKESYAEELGSGKMNANDIRRIAKSLQQQGSVFSPAFFGKIFDPKTANMLRKEFASEESTIRASVASANSFLKAIKLGFDFGAGQIQLLPTLYKNPAIWAKSQFKALGNMATPQVFAEYVRKNADAVRELARYGSSVGRLQEMMTGLGVGEPLPKLLGKIPVVGKALAEVPIAFGRQFQSVLDIAKIELWKSVRDGLTNDKEKQQAVQAIETQLLTGRMESAMVPHSRALLERVAVLAPSYYRGSIQHLAGLAEKGVGGSILRKSMGAFILGSLATYFAYAKFVGMSDDEIKERMNPARADFMSWRIKEGDKEINIGMGGIFRSYLRLAGNVTKTSIEHPGNWKSLTSDENPLSRWFRGHAAPLPAAAWDMITGRSFLGKKAEVTGEVGTALLPLAAETGQTKTERMASMLGFNAYQAPVAVRDVAREMFPGRPIESLTMKERADVQKKLKERTGPPTEDEQRRIMERATQTEITRREDLRSMLPSDQLKWITANRLLLRSYGVTLGYAKQDVSLTEDERAFLQQETARQYQRVIGGLMESPTWDAKTPTQKQARFDSALEMARTRARVALQRHMREARQPAAVFTPADFQ